MANYATLKAAIQQVIKTNGNEEITGALLQQSLLAMISSLGAGYQFMGIATPSTNPGTPDQNVYYIASTAGTYSNFGGIVLISGEVAFLTYNGSWTKQSSGFASEEKVSQLGDKVTDLDDKTEDTIVHSKNLADFATIVDGLYIASNGKLVTDAPSKAFLFPCEPSTTYTVSKIPSYPFRIVYLNTNPANNVQGGGYVSGSSSANSLTITTAADSIYLFIWIYEQNSTATMQQIIDSLQIEKGGVATEYEAPGWTCIDKVARKQIEQFAPIVQDVNMLKKVDEGKLDKIIGTNLVNPNDLEDDKIIFANGTIGDATTTGYSVSGYIPVDGKSVVSNAYVLAESIASYNVYDANKALLRTVVQNSQYTYQSGDAYVRFTFRTNKPMANYGTTLAAYEPYTDYKPVADLSKQVSSMSGLVEQVPNKLDKVLGTNIVNPDEIITGAALSWGSVDGEPSTGLASNYVVSGFIPVDGKNIISNAWSTNNAWATMFIYDENKNFLRNNGTNQQYTYQEGDAYVRISWKSSSVSNWKANYGTTLADYAPYTDYKPLQDLDNRVTVIEGKIGTVDYDYTTVALFKSLAVVGDSYSSGAIYGVTGAVEGRHDGMAWINIMARRNGIQSTGLYATPSQNTTKFLDPTDSRYSTYGLGALLADSAKDLYFIMLGINAEPDGVGVGTVDDCKVDWTQNTASFCGNIGKIIGNIKTHAPNAKIVCIVENMLFSNLNPAVNAEKRQAIIDAAGFYGVAWMEAADNPFFSSTFYVSQLHTNHPVGITYAGMAVGFEKLLSACIQDNPAYFVDYVND